MKFNVKCAQKLNDGDTALVEEYCNVDKYDVANIINEYYARSAEKSYVNSFTINVEIKR